MEKNITTMLATPSRRVAPNAVVAVRLRAIAAMHGAGKAAAASCTVAAHHVVAAHVVVKARLCFDTTIRSTAGPLAWSPPTC